ncbi:response regulator [Sulfurimonas sp.]|jgi:CheY-like chemotaxis protein/serine phosphatase RsbU (regulator of sigma subunit)/anti-sigma regulatory factor (Ser/Thr protein kinase)|uniref:response regulator n=1 Tax=Sulfurimonas sp. TaxID=2022749 RepID=UPI002A359149|nr:response regulator [Sulfurimonas sp.]MDY0122792.1 response regulator [Sulfurimonas sp.]
MNGTIDSSILVYLKSLTLLCVEDNKTTQLLYQSIFEDLLSNVILADNGEDGYEKFQNQKIDLIIVDYDMPILNGIDMIKKIRDVDKEIPIILVSAIQDIDVIVQALQLNVNNFLKKPIIVSEVMQAIENVSKLIFAGNYLKEQREKKIRELERKEEYNSYQEDLAFSKELNIVRNDFYYKMLDTKRTTLVDFLYKPLDILSGDAYSARKICDKRVFYFIVDGMGKGLSASLSSMLLTAYVNHVLDKMVEDFSLEKLIKSALEYIKPIILDEEALSAEFIVMDYKNSTMQYSKFAMPPSLTQSIDNEVIKIRSNNPPMSKFTDDFTVSQTDISKITKLLFYSDGLVENSVREKGKLYANFIENDFLRSFTKDELKEKLLYKIDAQEDDMTFIFINQLPSSQKEKRITKTFESTLNAVEEANDWYTDIWSGFTTNYKLAYNAGVVFSELFMNAYEHGNLGLDAKTKHRLLSEDIYFTTLEELQRNCDKQITVTIDIIEANSNRYMATLIKDEGQGFNTNILREIFKDRDNFNGRGIYISRQSSLGLYYNSEGTSVLFLHKA